MTVPFRLQSNVARLEMDVDEYKVTVTIEPKLGMPITTEDADMILTR